MRSLLFKAGPRSTSKRPFTRRPLMEQMTGKSAEIDAWPKGIAAITLFVDDLAAAKQFYLTVFGLPLDFEDAVSAVFKFGNTLVNLLKTTAAGELVEPAKVGTPEAGSRVVFTINVDDVDAMCAQIT